MISVNDRECIRRAYFAKHKSIREIARELGHSRKTVRKALESAEPDQYTLQEQRRAPILGSYKELIDQLLDQSQKMPRKQRYTTHKIYEHIRAAGYTGSEFRGAGIHCPEAEREKAATALHSSGV